jgi:hypothetical protein
VVHDDGLERGGSAEAGATTSSRGGTGSSVVMRIVAVSVDPWTVGFGSYSMVKSTCAPGAIAKGVTGAGSTVKSLEPETRSTLNTIRSWCRG